MDFQISIYIYCYNYILQVIAAEGEHKASRALRHAADVISDSPAALQVNLKLSTADDI